MPLLERRLEFALSNYVNLPMANRGWTWAVPQWQLMIIDWSQSLALSIGGKHSIVCVCSESAMKCTTKCDINKVQKYNAPETGSSLLQFLISIRVSSLTTRDTTRTCHGVFRLYGTVAYGEDNWAQWVTLCARVRHGGNSMSTAHPRRRLQTRPESRWCR